MSGETHTTHDDKEAQMKTLFGRLCPIALTSWAKDLLEIIHDLRVTAEAAACCLDRAAHPLVRVRHVALGASAQQQVKTHTMAMCPHTRGMPSSSSSLSFSFTMSMNLPPSARRPSALPESTTVSIAAIRRWCTLLPSRSGQESVHSAHPQSNPNRLGTCRCRLNHSRPGSRYETVISSPSRIVCTAWIVCCPSNSEQASCVLGVHE